MEEPIDMEPDALSAQEELANPPEQASEPPEEPEPGPMTGRVLLGLALVAWAGWAFARWGPRPDGVPAVAVATEASEAPDMAAADAPEPEPAVAEDGAEPTTEEEQPDDTPVEPIEIDPEWASKLEAPDLVQYTVRHGGTLENVANLYKLYHHEILELNPGIDLKHELAPGSKVTVYREKEGRESVSIGFPGNGRLEGPVAMPEGPGRILKMIPWKSWATRDTVAVMDGVLKEWAKRYPKADPVLVGNMSSPTGGKLNPHSSHQSGRDVDLGYMQKQGLEEEYNWREMTAHNLDAARTWDLIRLLADTGAVEVIFIDRGIQKLLHEHAVKHEKMTPRQLKRWLEYPASGGTRALVQHVKGHVDHMHVRVACPPGESRCKTRGHG